MRILFLSFFIFIVKPLFAQLEITPAGDSLSITLIVKDYFLGGNITVNNIRYEGDTSAIGIFTDSQSVFGFNAGIILSTGLAEHAVGPNGRPNAGANFGRYFFYDDDLIPSKSMCDGVKLEFDFVPRYDSVVFQYVFASEEYPEFVGKDFNDLFAFFISPKGSRNKPINIALLPNGTSVSINNINHKKNSEWYVENHEHQAPFYTLTEYDGFTKLLTATAYVQPYKPYHLKLVIADVTDCEYDSGVLLSAKSFKSLPRVKSLPKPVSKNYYFHFDINSAILSAKEQIRVKLLGDSINRFAFDSIVVIGHTDSTGDEITNMWLSRQRAITVKSILEKNNKKNITIKAYGKGNSHPIANNDTEKNRALNRRVQILFYRKK